MALTPTLPAPPTAPRILKQARQRPGQGSPKAFLSEDIGLGVRARPSVDPAALRALPATVQPIQGDHGDGRINSG